MGLFQCHTWAPYFSALDLNHYYQITKKSYVAFYSPLVIYFQIPIAWDQIYLMFEADYWKVICTDLFHHKPLKFLAILKCDVAKKMNFPSWSHCGVWFLIWTVAWNFVAAVPLGIIVVDNDADLEQVRRHINQLQEVSAVEKCIKWPTVNYVDSMYMSAFHWFSVISHLKGHNQKSR